MASSEPIRLQKIIADAGLASRRAAEALIAEGRVSVNGKIAELGHKAVPGSDDIVVDGKPLHRTTQPKITLAAHKPRGLVCSNSDPHQAKTVFDLLPRSYARWRFFCAGRLDLDSEGLVILTTDGELANRLMHPSSFVVKRYRVTLTRPFSRSRLPLLLKGVEVEGEHLKVERAFLLRTSSSGTSTELEVHMNHGKKREIRQLFQALSHDVKRLRRYQIGAFSLRGIPLRGIKQLSRKEIDLLFATEAAARS